MLIDESDNRLWQESIKRLKEKELFKLEQIKDFESRVESCRIEYLRRKSRSRERIDDLEFSDASNISNIYEQHDQESSDFLNLLKEGSELYKKSLSEAVQSSYDNNL